jgi:hypothetical protein
MQFKNVNAFILRVQASIFCMVREPKLARMCIRAGASMTVNIATLHNAVYMPTFYSCFRRRRRSGGFNFHELFSMLAILWADDFLHRARRVFAPDTPTHISYLNKGSYEECRLLGCGAM